MAIIDVVRFDGLKSKDWLIFKYFSEELVWGTQLIVQEGQTALFVKSGMVADIFYPGTYTLETNNLPILKKLVNLPFGGRTPFSAEIYFINTALKMDVAWGTTDPIQLIDPKYHIKLRIRAFGQMGLMILDAVTLFKNVIGGMQKADIVKIDKVKEYYRGLLVIKVKSAIANAIITDGISALEISTKLDVLSNAVSEKISDEFYQYGLIVSNFYIQSINFPDEDFERINQILEKNAAFEILGGERYATMRSFDVYEGAATNENGVAGAFVAGGLGIGAATGVGVGVGKSFSNTLQTMNTRTCFNCGNEIQIGAMFCPFCGASLADGICECGNKLTAGARFCSQCGKQVE